MGSLLTVKEVAEMLCVSTATIGRLVRAHDISHIRVGKQVRFTQEHVDEYLSIREIRTQERVKESVERRKPQRVREIESMYPHLRASYLEGSEAAS